MLEYFAYRKFKKNRDEKVHARHEAREEAAAAASQPGAPVLTDDDELFFERLTSESGFSDEEGKRPPLPPRLNTPEYTWDSDLSDADSFTKGKKSSSTPTSPKEEHATTSTTNNTFTPLKKRFSVFRRNAPAKSSLAPSDVPLTPAEEAREKDDLSRVLDDLNLAARNNKTISLSQDSQKMLAEFTLILKDLVNGVPTAATDMRHLFDDHDGTLARNYEKLPKSMQKLVTSLPTKVTGSIAPELLAVAAESQGLRGTDLEPTGTLKEQAMKLMIPKNMAELVTKPSAIVGMLKAIMNALKVRWPAFIGTNVIWSVALFCKSIPDNLKVKQASLLMSKQCSCSSSGTATRGAVKFGWRRRNRLRLRWRVALRRSLMVILRLPPLESLHALRGLILGQAAGSNGLLRAS